MKTPAGTHNQITFKSLHGSLISPVKRGRVDTSGALNYGAQAMCPVECHEVSESFI